MKSDTTWEDANGAYLGLVGFCSACSACSATHERHTCPRRRAGKVGRASAESRPSSEARSLALLHRHHVPLPRQRQTTHMSRTQGWQSRQSDAPLRLASVQMQTAERLDGWVATAPGTTHSFSTRCVVVQPAMAISDAVSARLLAAGRTLHVTPGFPPHLPAHLAQWPSQRQCATHT